MDDFFYNPEPEAPEEVPREPEPEASEEVPSEPEPEAPEETPNEPEPEAPPTEETEDGSESMKDLIDAIGDLNETITGAVTQEPEELPAGGEGGEGGFGGESQVTESASVDLAPVVQVLERNEKLLIHTNELLEQQGEVLVMQHNDLNCRDFGRKDRNAWVTFFSQHRKLGFNIILITQSDRMLDKQIRSLVEDR